MILLLRNGCLSVFQFYLESLKEIMKIIGKGTDAVKDAFAVPALFVLEPFPFDSAAAQQVIY